TPGRPPGSRARSPPPTRSGPPTPPPPAGSPPPSAGSGSAARGWRGSGAPGHRRETPGSPRSSPAAARFSDLWPPPSLARISRRARRLRLGNGVRGRRGGATVPSGDRPPMKSRSSIGAVSLLLAGFAAAAGAEPLPVQYDEGAEGYDPAAIVRPARALASS